MNPSTPEKSKKPIELTRRGKIVLGAAAVGVVGATMAGGAALEAQLGSPEVKKAPSVSETVHVSDTIKGSEDNWGHDTAEKILLFGAGEATAKAISELNPEDTSTTAGDIVEMIKDQERYQKVRDMLEDAAEDGQIAQPGDIISSDITATVTEAPSNDGEYNYVVDFKAENTQYDSPE